MHAIADTQKLVEDEIITDAQARELERRGREVMIALAINCILCAGILAATAGLIFWLADPMLVAIFGGLALVAGLLVLAKLGEQTAMFGNASALIGAGMLLGGAGIELVDKAPDIAGWVMVPVGAVVAVLAGWFFHKKALTTRFVTGSIMLMGVALHLAGIAALLVQYDISGLLITLAYFYAAVVIAVAGYIVDVRFVSALAIVPFAQMLDTGTFYWHAVYAFYSPETTLSILQMAILVGLSNWAKNVWKERSARHARVLSIMGFIVANLCALVGSLWGDVVGEHVWGPGHRRGSEMSWEEFSAARVAFRETALFISRHVYSILWAIVLIATIYFAAIRQNRGLFNTALVFAAIHAYTQLFENFADEPLAYVIGGLAAIPLAWGMWRLNRWMAEKEAVG